MSDDTYCFGFIHGEQIHAAFMTSFVDLLGAGGMANIISLKSGPLLCLARRMLVQMYLERSQSPWLLMVDTDMVLPPDVFARLRHHASENRIVGGLCFKWDYETRRVDPVMFNENDQFIREWEPGALVKVAATGAACLLIHRSVFERVPAPWFMQHPLGSWGEDQGFCKRCALHETEIWVDTSLVVGHCKQVIVGEQDWHLHLEREQSHSAQVVAL